VDEDHLAQGLQYGDIASLKSFLNELRDCRKSSMEGNNGQRVSMQDLLYQVRLKQYSTEITDDLCISWGSGRSDSVVVETRVCVYMVIWLNTF
jgi:hypothetical protein